jgi:hypothetical protein
VGGRVRRPSIPPSLTIRLALEAPPVVSFDCLNDGDEARLTDWILSKPELVDLLDRALLIAQRRREEAS